MKKTFPTLYKKTSTGAIQYWEIKVEEHGLGPNLPYSLPKIKTEYGQTETESPQVTYDIITEGKNTGKKNATTPYEQAEKEALAKWQKQKKKGYVESIEAAQAEELDDLIEGGVVPMLAHKFSDHGHKIKYPCFVQPKLDGIRCIAIIKNGKCTLWSRTRKPINSCPHIIQELETIFENRNIILDGELFNSSTNAKPYTTFNVDGQEILIDTEDVPKLEGYAVCISANGYPVVSIRRELKYIHRLVMNSPKEDIDHINRNRLDARKSNLRLVNMSQNIANSTKRITNTSGYKGVIYFKRDSNWQAQITKDYKRIHIGYFDTAEKAAKAYDAKAIELFGDYAVLNFPNNLKSFEDIVSAVRSKDPTATSSLVQYHIYDIINDMSFVDRKGMMDELLSWTQSPESFNSSLRMVETLIVYSEEKAMFHFEEFRKQGYEGAMLRNADSKYVNKRSYDLLKVKEFDDAEFEIIGIEEGRGKLAGHVGAFVCRTADGKTFAAKMSGDTEQLANYFRNHDLWRNKHLTVQYQGLTSKEGVPRFPVGIAIRDYE